MPIVQCVCQIVGFYLKKINKKNKGELRRTGKKKTIMNENNRETIGR